MEHITVIGTGPFSRAATRSLVEAGCRITVATRSGTQLPRAQAARADAVMGDSPETLTPGASIVACCGITYTAAGWCRDWPLAIDNLIETAERQGAILVIMGSHCSYTCDWTSIRVTGPLDYPPLALGEVRAKVSCRLFAIHEQGRIHIVEVRGSSYLGADAGPGAYFGPQFVDSLLARGTASALDDPDLPYAMTVIPGFGRLLARAAADPKISGRAQYAPSAPAVDVRELARMLLQAADHDDEPRLRSMPASLLRVLGWFSPTLRAVGETLHQNTEPFAVGNTDICGLLGKTHTLLEEMVADIVAARGRKAA